jgi:hypothetical protein
MSLNKRAALISGCFILALILAPPFIRGDDWNLATKFTVSQPFEVPGMTLQPNTPYVIRLHDSPSTRTVVQVFNEDQSKMLTMFMGISDERREPTDETVFTFIEVQPGHPLPIKEWFYPGRITGLEFVYPKEQALEIARHAREPVLAADGYNLHKLSSISVEAIGPIGTQTSTTATASTSGPKSETAVAELEKPSVAESEPQPAVEPVAEEQKVEESVQIAENNPPEEVQPVEQAAATEPADTERELPRTAGELPLVALIGALCLGAGLGLKVLSAKS